MELELRNLSDVTPYHSNPRCNDDAVDLVAESVRQCGYCSPIVVDESGVVLAGHTRLKALNLLGWDQAQVVVLRGLTEEQKRKYRILDNKTAEYATWDLALLEIELQGLDFQGFDFGFEEAPDGESLDIDESEESIEQDARAYLSFGKNKVAITDQELEMLEEMLDKYIAREGVSYGFGLWIAENCKN